MKKILLAAAAATILSSSALAAEGNFYVKANAGWSKLNKVSGLKSKNDASLGLGAGYYVMDNVRADLSYDHLLNPNFKAKGDSPNKLKAKGDSLLLNGFVDLFDVSVAKVFAGAGVGLSMVSGKYTYTNNQKAVVSVKIKKKNNFAYAIYAGASTEFAPGVNAELTYSFRDLGKLKKPKDVNDKLGSLRGHNVAAGVRFDI